MRRDAFSHRRRGHVNPVMHFCCRQVFPNTADAHVSRAGSGRRPGEVETTGQVCFLGSRETGQGVWWTVPAGRPGPPLLPKPWLGVGPLRRDSAGSQSGDGEDPRPCRHRPSRAAWAASASSSRCSGQPRAGGSGLVPHPLPRLLCALRQARGQAGETSPRGRARLSSLPLACSFWGRSWSGRGGGRVRMPGARSEQRLACRAGPQRRGQGGRGWGSDSSAVSSRAEKSREILSRLLEG